MSKLAKFKVICESDIIDITGREIKPGNVIAFSSPTNKDLFLRIVTKITKHAIIVAGFKVEGHWDKIAKQYIIDKKTINPSFERTMLVDQEIQSHIVVISDPVYCITNPKIAAQLEVCAALKDAEIFPADYKFGNSL